MPTIQVSKLHSFKGHSSGIYCLELLTESSFISAGGDGQIVKWDVSSFDDGNLIAKVDAPVYGLCIDVNRLLIGESGRAVHMIDIETKSPIRSVAIKAPVFSIRRFGDQFLMGTGAGELIVFDLSLIHI